jgi:RNA recognition motif-containing protein
VYHQQDQRYQVVSQQLPHHLQEHQFEQHYKQDLRDTENTQGYSSEGQNDSSMRRSNSRGIGDLSRSIVLRIVGLPQSTEPDDVVRLFDGLEMVGDGVHFLPSSEGTGSPGDAFIEFTSESWAKKALTRSPISLDNKTVLVLRSSHREMAIALTSSPDSVRYLDAGPGSFMKEGSTSDTRPMSMPMCSQESGLHGLAIRKGGLSLGEGSKDSSPGDNEYFAAERDNLLEKSTTCTSGSLRTGAENDGYFARVVGHWDAGGEELGRLLADIPGLCNNGVFVDEDVGRGGTLAYLAFRSASDRDNAIMSCTDETGTFTRDTSHRLHVVSSKTLSSDSDRPSGCVVRISGLPSVAEDIDIVEIFKELDIPEGGISRVDDGDGLTGGSAWVRFASREQAKYAVDNFNSKLMGQCRIVVQNVQG